MSNTEPDYILRNLFEFKPSKGDLKRLEIIKATIECLATIGFDKTTYESIAKIVGTRRAHINYYFGDKHEILMACIRYIVSNYQQVSLQHIEQARVGRDMLINFIEGPYIWAKKNPQELSVMLLFYYLCTYSEDYQKLHDKIRTGGAERLMYILHEKMSYSKKNARLLSKVIQNSMSGFILDAATTSLNDLKKAEDQNKKFILKLIDHYKEKEI